jgi:hypothetical protein
MRPVIVVWTYLALGILLLDNSIGVMLSPSTLMPENAPFIIKVYAPLPTMIIVAMSLFSIIGLAKKYQWARMLSLVTISVEGLKIFGLSIYVILFQGTVFQDVEFENEGSFELMAIGIPFLFLAYKIYSSEPLKCYLETHNK